MKEAQPENERSVPHGGLGQARCGPSALWASQATGHYSRAGRLRGPT